MTDTAPSFAGYAILELMGHRRLAGYVTDVEFFGGRFCRIDVLATDGCAGSTQFYSAGAIYCLTPVSETVALAVAHSNRPMPVQRWELPLVADDPLRMPLERVLSTVVEDEDDAGPM